MRTTLGLLVGAIAGVTAAAACAQEQQGGPTSAAPFGDFIQDERVYTHLLLDELEGRFGADNSFRWEGEGWAGTDTDRLWLKSEGETNARGAVEDGQQELLYDRAFSSYFDLQAGVRSDIDSGSGRTWAAFGVEGLAPLFVHVSGTAYASSEGHYAARLEGDYDLLLTQRLILQPQLEMNFYSKDDPGRRIGSGLADFDSGLRLRYEFSRKFAPYLALTYEGRHGATAGFAQAEGERASELRFAVGLRTWI